jgi:hypothetical protein
VFYGLFDIVAATAVGKHKFRFQNTLVSLDSTVIDLCLSMYDWAKDRRTAGAVKLHLVLDHDDYLPCFGRVTDGKVADVKAAGQIAFAPGTIVVDDRGDNDYRLFAEWTDSGVFFVTRMKVHAPFEVVEEREPPQHGDILKDQTFRLTGTGAQTKCPHTRRGRPRRHWRHTGIPDHPPRHRRQHHCGNLHGSLADRAVCQGAQADPEDQNLRWHLGERGQDPDVDGIALDAVAALSALVLPIRLEPG